MSRLVLLLLLTACACGRPSLQPRAVVRDTASKLAIANPSPASVTIPRNRNTPVPPGLLKEAPVPRNGKSGRLFFTYDAGKLSYPHEPLEPLPPLALSASLRLWIPALLPIDSPKGPWVRLFDETKDVRAEAGPGLSLALHNDGLVVSCNDVGVMPVMVTAVALDGALVTDSYDVECIAPTRFETATEPGATYLVSASRIDVDVSWFGRRSDGTEVKLLGDLPVTLAPGELAVAHAGSPFSGRLELLPTKAMAGTVNLTSAGLTATVPVRAIDSGWHLKMHITGEGPRMSVQVHAVDLDGAPLRIRGCALTGRHLTRHADVPDEIPVVADRHGCSAGRLLRGSKLHELEGGRLRGDWRADSVCATVLAQKVCQKVPN